MSYLIPCFVHRRCEPLMNSYLGSSLKEFKNLRLLRKKAKKVSVFDNSCTKSLWKSRKNSKDKPIHKSIWLEKNKFPIRSKKKKKKRKAGKNLKQTTNQLLVMFCLYQTIRKNKTRVHFEMQIRSSKPSNSLNDHRHWKMVWSCYQKLV